MGRIYTEEQKEKRREQKRLWYQKHKSQVSEYNKEYSKKYREENRDLLLEKKREYYSKQEHIDERNKYMEKYNQTQIGRAANLASSYHQMDKKSNVGETTITKEWIVDNIFTKSCVYCGEKDWEKLGCDRIDNKLPHTPTNVVPCCGKCNVKKGKTLTYDEYMKKVRNES